MIDRILELIRVEINNFINTKVGGPSQDNRVILTSFVDNNGQVAIPSDSVGLSLLNIEEERHLKTGTLLQVRKGESSSQFVSPPVSLNLQIMFTAYFNNYPESLKHLSYILAAFQTKPVFDTANTPSISGVGTGKLVFELNTLPLEQQHYIWSMIGLRYLPSVIYKVRLLLVFEEDVVTETANIGEIVTSTTLKEVND